MPEPDPLKSVRSWSRSGTGWRENSLLKPPGRSILSFRTFLAALRMHGSHGYHQFMLPNAVAAAASCAALRVCASRTAEPP